MLPLRNTRWEHCIRLTPWASRATRLRAKAVKQDVGGREPDKEVMARIKQCLQLNSKARPAKPVAYVPQQLAEIVEDLKSYIQDTGLVVTEIISIQYGKKIRIKMGRKEAEINLFFGKRGFSVVKSPRCGTDNELNDICAELIQGFVNNL